MKVFAIQTPSVFDVLVLTGSLSACDEHADQTIRHVLYICSRRMKRFYLRLRNEEHEDEKTVIQTTEFTSNVKLIQMIGSWGATRVYVNAKFSH